LVFVELNTLHIGSHAETLLFCGLTLGGELFVLLSGALFAVYHCLQLCLRRFEVLGGCLELGTRATSLECMIIEVLR
jgi:hypothetical protein